MEQATLTKAIEDVNKTLADLQAAQEKNVADGRARSEEVETLKGQFQTALESVKTIEESIAEAKGRADALELMLARIPEKNVDGKTLLSDPEYRAGFKTFIRTRAKSDIAEDVVEKEVEILAKAHGIDNKRGIAELKAHLIGSGPDGGYFVPTDVQSEIVRRVYEFSPMRRLATVITTGRDKVAYPIDDDLTINGYWADELDARTETDTAKLGLEEFQTHTQYAEPGVSVEMLEDATIDVEGFIRGKIGDIFAKMESIAHITGDGAKRPRGILAYPETAVETYARGSIGTKETNATATLTADDIIKFQYNLIDRYQANATWLCNRQTFGGIATLKTATTGDYLINPRILFEGVAPQLLGKPVEFAPDLAAEDNPASMTAGVKPLVYGDFREGYLVVDRLGITVLRDPYTDKRFVFFSTRRRTGGGVKNFQAFKVMKIKA